MKTDNNKAWFLMLPAMGILAVVGVVPLLAVFNYAFFDIFTLEKRFWIGTEWFAELVRSPDVYASLARSLFFSCLVIAVQFPLGIGIALIIPRSRSISAAILILVSIPLLIPWNLIPMFWLNLLHPDFGLLSALFDATGIPFDYKFNTAHTYILLVLMDTWHWIGLVVVLAYASLKSIPQPYLQAAKIDGASAWQTFRFIQMPKLYGVMTMALLLRTVDSLMIYTEAFAINAGGPDGATSFLALDLGEEIAAFNYGPAAARSVLYFLIVLTLAWGFRVISQHQDTVQ